MGGLIDLTGQRFGYWTVVCRSQREGIIYWVCQCICKKRKAVLGRALREEKSRSCGCKNKEFNGDVHFRHGHKGLIPTSEYNTWGNMKDRCYNPKNASYQYYGGRGISVCDRWRNSFENFIADMGLKSDPKLWIDRKDSDKDYEPDNCRWATAKEQANNRRPPKPYKPRKSK